MTSVTVPMLYSPLLLVIFGLIAGFVMFRMLVALYKLLPFT